MESGTAEFPGRGAVGLGKSSKNHRVFFRRDTHAGVRYLNTDFGMGPVPLKQVDPHHNLSFPSELDGIADQIRQYLVSICPNMSLKPETNWPISSPSPGGTRTLLPVVLMR